MLIDTTPRRALLFPAALGLAGAAFAVSGAFAAQPQPLLLAAGARVGVVNLLDPELTHYHAARQVQEGFLRTYTVDWPVNALLLTAVTPQLTRRGLAAVPMDAGIELRRARESCFLEAAFARGLPSECAPLYARLAAAEHVDALIVLGPGRNDSAHAGATRHRELPDYLRGWCIVSGQGAAASPPALLNLSELLLIGVSPAGAVLAGRAWGGNGHSWQGWQPPADLRALPPQLLEQLRPSFAAMLAEQADALLVHVEVAR